MLGVLPVRRRDAAEPAGETPALLSANPFPDVIGIDQHLDRLEAKLAECEVAVRITVGSRNSFIRRD